MNELRKAKDHGFEGIAEINLEKLELMDEVRAMCASDKCHMYNKCWSCPPACGTLEECRKEIEDVKGGILVQTIGEVEDSLDYEGMMELEAKHKERFLKLAYELRQEGRTVLALGSGCCTYCKKCSYPDAPCRFPERSVSSMEAYGMLVSQVCSDSQLPYYYGTNKIAFTGCYLFTE